MKQKLYILSTLLILFLTIMLGQIFDRLIKNEQINETHIYVYPLDKTFILPKEVAKLMPLKNKTYEKINIVSLEKQLEKNNYIHNAEVFKDLNGRLTAKIKQYQPIARIWQNNQSYYLDQEGNKKPLSIHFTENVPLIFGEIPNKYKENLVYIIKTINTDPILKNIVAELHIKNNLVSIKTDLLKADILIDITTDNKQQLTKLKAIYAYLFKKKQTQKYNKIDLRYAQQAICK